MNPSDDPHGRQAHSPVEIPARGWWDIAKRIFAEMSNDRLLAVAAGVTFYALLAIFPAIAAFVSVYGLVADRATLAEHVNAMSGIIPAGGISIIGDQLARLTSQGEGKLGFAFAISLAAALWSANAGMKAIFDALNVIYDETEKRGFFALNALSLSFTLGAILFLVLGVTSIAVVPIALEYLGLQNATQALFAALRWPVMLLIATFALSVLYRYGPSRSDAKWRWLTVGSITASMLWIAASLLFSWYVANFGSYDRTYGSLGAAIGFMTWIWISTAIVLTGAEISAETEHQTVTDSTTGAPRPIGQRGAIMADTIGEGPDQ
ncbi:YihY/virulence factor BrkB family protein [Flaviflagellibacter deserti]|uniref:YihY/virulence factor BrkB family protein n=1 Tax=Flaviflagellibacter deserti TaxID=2267266 RepID=A0ABV9Z3N7_9HYPH